MMRRAVFLLSLALIFTLPWEGVIRIPGLGTVAKLLGFAVAALWLAVIVITGQIRKPVPFHFALGAFVIWNALSVFWSKNPTRTMTQVETWVLLLVFVYLLWDLYTTREAIHFGLQAFVLGAYVAVSSSVSSFISGNAFYTNYERFSPDGTNPDGFGFVVALGIPVAWYLAVSEDQTKLGNILKIVNYIYVPMAFLGIALSGTRTASIAAIPGMAFGLASLSRPRPSIRFLILASLSAAILVMLPRLQDLTSFQRLGTVGTELTQGDLNQRAGIWADGWVSFLERPVLGVGADMYRSINHLGKVAHNSFLSVLVELGLIGFILFGIVLAIAFLTALRQPKWEARFWVTVLLVWAIGASTLTWEYRKTTWFFVTLLIANGAVVGQRAFAQALFDSSYVRPAPLRTPMPYGRKPSEKTWPGAA